MSTSETQLLAKPSVIENEPAAEKLDVLGESTLQELAQGADPTATEQVGGEVGPEPPVANRKVRAGRRAAKQSIKATQAEVVDNIIIINAQDVDDYAEARTDTVAQHAGQLALQELEPPPEDAPGPVVDIRDYEAIFMRFQGPIINFLYRMVGNREEAFDLSQDVFVKVFRALSGGDRIKEGALSSWVYRIASNTATDAMRRRKLISWMPLSLFEEDRGIGAGVLGSSPFDQALVNRAPTNAASMVSISTNSYDGSRFEDRLADREIIERVLGLLPDKYRSALLLYEHEGYSVAEIAGLLRVTSSAIKMRLMRAREYFIAIYKREAGETPQPIARTVAGRRRKITYLAGLAI